MAIHDCTRFTFLELLLNKWVASGFVSRIELKYTSGTLVADRTHVSRKNRGDALGSLGRGS